MRNYVQPGHNITAVTPSGGVTSGDPVLIGNLFGIAATTQAAGDEVELATVGVFDLPKAAVAASAGGIAYFDATAKAVTNTANSGANKRVGVFTAAALSGDATGRVRLDGAAT